MVTRFAPKNHSETMDRIVSAFLTAPTFFQPGLGRAFTLDEIFDDMLYGVENVKAKTRIPEKLVILEQVLAKLHEAKAALQANQERPGIMALADAKELFRKVRGAEKKKK
jgi:hypothetical protein